MDDTTKKKQRHTGFGRRKLSPEEKIERILHKNLDDLYKKMKGNKARSKAPQPLSPEDAKVMESCTRSLQILMESKAKKEVVEAQAEPEFDGMSIDEIRAANNALKQKKE